MELFLELGFTVAISLVCTFFLVKFLFVGFGIDVEDGSVLRSSQDVIEPDFEAECENLNWVSDRRVGVVHKVVEINEFIGESIQGDLDVGCDEHGSVFECVEDVFDECPERVQYCKIEKGMAEDEVDLAYTIEKDDVKKDLLDDEEDWEGIESTELERDFGTAVVFVGSKSNADEIVNLGYNVRLQLYGLHKIATEGHCQEPQPMAFNISARAKWKAWQQLGNMTPEAAMEQYIAILSKTIPGWTRENSSKDSKWFLPTPGN